MHLRQVIVMTIWLSYAVISTFKQYQSFEVYDEVRVTASFSSILGGIAGFASVIQTAYVLIGVAGLPKWMNVTTYVVLTAIYLGLAGNSYILYWAYSDSNISNTYNAWYANYVWFNVFTLLFIQAPVAYMIYMIIFQYAFKNEAVSSFKRLINLLQKDLYFSGLVGTTIFSITLYFVLRYLDLSYNIVFGSERIWRAFENIRGLFFFIPFLVNCLILEYVPYVIANRSKYEAMTILSKEVKIMLVDQSIMSKSKKRLKAKSGASGCGQNEKPNLMAKAKLSYRNDPGPSATVISVQNITTDSAPNPDLVDKEHFESK